MRPTELMIKDRFSLLNRVNQNLHIRISKMPMHRSLLFSKKPTLIFTETHQSGNSTISTMRTNTDLLKFEQAQYFLWVISISIVVLLISRLTTEAVKEDGGQITAITSVKMKKEIEWMKSVFLLFGKDYDLPILSKKNNGKIEDTIFNGWSNPGQWELVWWFK